jgi:hypothetical protein
LQAEYNDPILLTLEKVAERTPPSGPPIGIAGEAEGGRHLGAEAIVKGDLHGCGAKIGSKAYLTTQQLWDESGRHVKLG